MPIGFRVFPEDKWLAHAKAVKIARGTACFGAMAAHFGTESPEVLEWRADRREPYDSDGEPCKTNKYQRWRKGKAPHDISLVHIHSRTAGAVRLAFWREHPLWELLAPQAPPMPRLLRLLESTSPNVRRILFNDPCGVIPGRFNHSPPTRAQILGIRNLRPLDAFVALLCLARKGEQMEDDTQHFLPSACAYDIFPRILYSYRPLRYRWEGLFACIERLYWNRVYMDGLYVEFPIVTVRLSLAQLDADPSSCLPEKSGRRLRAVIDESIF